MASEKAEQAMDGLEDKDFIEKEAGRLSGLRWQFRAADGVANGLIKAVLPVTMISEVQRKEIVAELLDRKLIIEHGTGKDAYYTTPIMWRINTPIPENPLFTYLLEKYESAASPLRARLVKAVGWVMRDGAPEINVTRFNNMVYGLREDIQAGCEMGLLKKAPDQRPPYETYTCVEATMAEAVSQKLSKGGASGVGGR